MTTPHPASPEELLPCPFCGEQPLIADAAWIEGAAMIYCAADECMGPRTTAANIQDATVQWNTRLAASSARAAVPTVQQLVKETGSRDAEDLADMANVGHSLMQSIETICKLDGPFKDWSPAQDPAEIVIDLYNALDDMPVEEIARAYKTGALAVHNEWCDALDRGESDPPMRPDFSEAANDYARSALGGTRATKSDGGVEGHAISGTGPALEQSCQPETPSAGIKPGPSDPAPAPATVSTAGAKS